MTHLVRSACIAIAGLFLLLIGASAASATLSMNPTTTTAINTGAATLFVLRVDGGRLTGTCRTIVVRKIIVIGISIGSRDATISGCSIGGTAVSITQTSAWTGTISALLSAGQITGVLDRISIGTNGARFASGPLACSFDVSGTVSSLTTVTPRTPPALFSVSSGTFSNAALDALGLTVSGVTGSGCPTIGIVNGARAAILATFVLSPSITGTLI